MRNEVEFSVCNCSGKHKSKNHSKYKLAPKVREYNRRVSEAKKAFVKAKGRKDKTIKIKVASKKK